MMADVNGKPALARVVDRLRRAAQSDVLAEYAKANGVVVHRGSEDDVLLRVVEAHRAMESAIAVEVTGDCTLLDPEVIDLGVATFLANDCDVVANVVKPSFPQGVDVQVFRRSLLEEVERTVRDSAVREHVSLHFYEHPETYRVLHLVAPQRYRAPERRFQLDYPEDLAFIREVYRRLEPVHGDAFGTPEVLALIAAAPELGEINAQCAEKPAR